MLRATLHPPVPKDTPEDNDGQMKIDVLHIDDCPNWVEAAERVRAALDSVGLGDTEIGFLQVATSEEAALVPFAGSPTILIDGSDAFPDAALTSTVSCRVYRVGTGFAGVPTIEQLRDAILLRSVRPAANEAARKVEVG